MAKAVYKIRDFILIGRFHGPQSLGGNSLPDLPTQMELSPVGVWIESILAMPARLEA